MSGKQRIYWDANCFLAYINEDPRWLATLETLLEDANVRRSIDIVTSVISVTEVAYAAVEKLKRVLNPSEEDRIDQLWTSPGIGLVEVNERVARLGREIIRDDVGKERTGKRTADIIHLATARFVRASALHTLDERLQTYTEQYGFPVTAPFTPQPKLHGL